MSTNHTPPVVSIHTRANRRTVTCFWCDRLLGDPACNCASKPSLVEADGWRTVYCSGERFAFATDAEAEMFAAQHVAVAS